MWTSSTADYARGVLHRICPPEIPLLFVWARERCTRRLDVEAQEVVWVKDLSKVKRLGYPLERVLMVDDTPAKLMRQYGNLVRVAPFYGEADDDELPALAAYLARIRDTPSFRALEKRGWRTRSESSAPSDSP